MKKKLPEYIVKCFQAAGYDDMDTIAKMDTSENPGNSISKIEQYIERKFSGNTEYVHDPSLPFSPFEFPPGHRDRICHFIHEVKTIKDMKSASTDKRKRSCTVKHNAKKPKIAVSKETILHEIQNTITRWVQKCKAVLQHLKQNEHYELIVSLDSGVPSASIKCLMCKKNPIVLHQRDPSQKKTSFLICNWTRHVLVCCTKCPPTHTLDKYFSQNKKSQQQCTNKIFGEISSEQQPSDVSNDSRSRPNTLPTSNSNQNEMQVF